MSNIRATSHIFAVAALLSATACGKPTPSPTPPATTGGADTAPADADAGKCTDYRDFDASALAPLPSTPHTATLEQVWKIVLTKHYDSTLGCLDWPAIRVEYGQKLTEAADEAAAYGMMNEMLGKLGQSHLAVVPPGRATHGEPRGATLTGPATVPVKVRVVEGVVAVVEAKVDGHNSGLPGGAQIVAVDDAVVAEALDAIKQRWTRDVEANFRAAQTVQTWLSCPEGAKKKVRFIPAGSDKEKSKTVKCTMLDREHVSLGNLQGVPVEVEHKMIPKTKVGYLRFNVWMIPLVAQIEAGLADLRKKGAESLILDLRGNPGGVGAMVVPVGRLMMAESADLGVMHMRDGEQIFAVTAGDDPFAGRVIVLVDEGTGSTSEIFAQAMQDIGRVQAFGAGPSQGAALPSLIEKLDSGAILQYVVADYRSPKDIAVEGRGVQPDQVVPETRAAFAKGGDPVLDAAVEALTAG
jgi:carboxyl-terminal processing protease